MQIPENPWFSRMQHRPAGGGGEAVEVQQQQPEEQHQQQGEGKEPLLLE